MESITSHRCAIHLEEHADIALEQHLVQRQYSKVFVLIDENTKMHCWPVLAQKLGHFADELVEIPSGEEHKTMATCVEVWKTLSQRGADRKSLLINLGGGVLTDLGGFVAATFKRGIAFIHIPTTLLAMVDASVGGKTGVDLGVLKNQVGIITPPQMVLIWPEFLETLEARQIVSGYAEMLKHGLIQDADYWKILRKTHTFTDAAYLQKSIAIKNAVVLQDPTEKGLRKILNFGHTLGHAIESYCLEHPKKEILLHGEAIAIGMVLEGYLSHKLEGLSQQALQEIKETFLHHFKRVDFTEKDIDAIVQLLRHDKKNSHGNINFVLLQAIGKAVTDVKVPESLFRDAFAYYKE